MPSGKWTGAQSHGRVSTNNYRLEELVDAANDAAFLAAKFWPFVRKGQGCWLWEGTRVSTGYGQLRYKGTALLPHRLAYVIANGALLTAETVDHLCRTPLCVRRDHLEAVSKRENTLRGEGYAATQAKKTHCLRGHLFDEANTRRIINKYGHENRRCRACNRDRQRTAYANTKMHRQQQALEGVL